MGTPGHMAHPFDVDRVQTGQDLIDYISDAILKLRAGEIAGSVKWDGINTSFKLITNENGVKDFRMDRGTSQIASVVGFNAEMAYEKWGRDHGMPQAIEKLLKIFNTALPSIEPELKILGMWDDPTKYFNTEYIEGRSNVQEYAANILAIHGINQFYEKKAQAHRIRKGISMDRPGLERPLDANGKPIKGGGIEIPYNHKALTSIIEKVKPIASKYGFEIYGDVPVNFDPGIELNIDTILETPISIQLDRGDTRTSSLREWLQMVVHPKDKKIKKIVRDDSGAPIGEKDVGALSKDIYVAVLQSAQEGGMPLKDYLVSEAEIQDAINGGIIYHATRLLGQEVKKVLTSEAGSLDRHEGVVLRGLEDFLVKLTGDFIIQGLASTHGSHPSVTESLLRDITIKISNSRDVTKTAQEWLDEMQNNNHTPNRIPRQVYHDIMNGGAIVDIVKKENAQEVIYNTVFAYINNILKEEVELEQGEHEETVNLDIVDAEHADGVSGNTSGGKTYALVPGSMKPPTLGHAGMIKTYSEMPGVDEVLVFVGAPELYARDKKTGEYKRDKKTGKLQINKSIREFPGRPEGITQAEAIDILKIMLPDGLLKPEGNVEIIHTSHASPMGAVYDFVSPEDKDVRQAQPGDIAILGASTKGNDSQRWESLVANADTHVRNGVEVLNKPVPPTLHGPGYTDLIKSEEAKEILAELPTIVKAKKKGIPPDLSNISAGDARHIMGFLGTDKKEIALQLLDTFFGEQSLPIILARLQLPGGDGPPLEEISAMGIGSAAGAVGKAGKHDGPLVGRSRSTRGKRKKKRKNENIDMSLVNEVYELLIERGILS